MNIGVILMTYGSPKTPNDIPQYLRNVYGGKDPKPETIAEFQRRYKLIGGSPLIKITQQQAEALEKELNRQPDYFPSLGRPFAKGSTLVVRGLRGGVEPDKKDQLKYKNKYRVRAGMRFSHPFINDVVKELTNKTDMLVGIIMSPQYSPIIMSGYILALENAVGVYCNTPLRIAKDWHLEPYFLQALAQRVTEALNEFSAKVQDNVPVIFSAHSMPKRVIDKEPNYIKDLKETASEVAKLSGLAEDRWMFCYQSAGHTPEEWLKPDFADIMPELARQGKKHVLIAPIQFLSDHLEILYDVGIAAKEQAEQYGIEFKRTQSLNTSPLFIKALANIVEETISKGVLQYAPTQNPGKNLF